MANLSPKQKTLATILAGVVVAVTPSLFTYLQARDEIKAKYQQANDEATAGYKALVSSVTDLQKAVKEQHDYIVKLEGHVEALEKMRWRPTTVAGTRPGTIGVGTPGTVGHGAGSGSGAGMAPDPKPPADLPPLPAPDFRPPPMDYNAAQTHR